MPIKPLSDDELKARVEAKMADALGAPDSEVARQRERNMRAYLAEPTHEWSPPEIEDRSDIVSTDVADTIEWMLPSLLRIFTASSDAIELVPRRPQYEGKATQVQEAIRTLFWDKLGGVTLLHEWFKDGLLSKVGFARVRYEKKFLIANERYEGLTEAQVEMVASDPEVEIVSQTPRQIVVNTTPQMAAEWQQQQQAQQGPQQAPQGAQQGQPGPQGQPPQQAPQAPPPQPPKTMPMTVIDIEVQRRTPDGGCEIEIIAPEEMRIDRAARYNADPAFIGQEYERRRSELEALGYDCEGISTHDRIGDSEKTLRSGINSSDTYGDDDEHDPLLSVCEAYLRTVTEGGVVWEHVVYVGEDQMVRETVDDHPYVWWCPAPMPHVFFGHCPADFAIEPQRMRTLFIRSAADNVVLQVNGRTGVLEGEANMDDLADSRPGGLVRMRRPDALVPIVQPDVSAAAWQTLEWAEQWVEKRTGFSRMSKGLSSEALNDTATGVLEITERADMRVEMIARHAAEALSKLLVKVMRCMSKYQDVAQTIRLRGQWVDVDPRDWSHQYEVRVKVGLGSGNKDREVQQLLQLVSIQMPMVQAGQVSPPAAIALARKVAQCMGQDEPEQFFPDPPPPQPPQPPLPLQIEQMKVQAEQSVAQGKVQAEQMMAQFRAQQDQAKAQFDAQMAAQAAEQQRRHELAVAQIQMSGKHRERLFELAAGLLAAQYRQQATAAAGVAAGLGAPVNLANGSQLDQSSQVPGINLDAMNGAAAAITQIADAISGNFGSPTQ